MVVLMITTLVCAVGCKKTEAHKHTWATEWSVGGETHWHACTGEGSNYTPNALKYLDNTPIIRGISGLELAELILKYYDKLSDKSKKIIPLSPVYIPDIKVD